VNSLLKDPTVDVSIGAAEAAGANSLNLIIPLSQVNPVAQLSLKRMGLIGARRGAVCPVSAAMQGMLGSSVNIINWKRMLGSHYKYNITTVRLKIE
jgi:hypothetical protein